jgi:hypothetical protein
MSRQARSVFFTAVLTAGAVVIAALPAGAQTNEGLILSGKASAAATETSSFLTAGMVRQAPPPGGGGAPASGIGVGAKIGPLWTSYNAASGSGFNYNTSTGWEGGIWFGGNRGGVIGVMGEVLYAKKTQESSNSSITGSTSLQYLEIPILTRINIGSRSRSGVSVYGLVGPVFDVNLKASIGSQDVKSNYQSLDIGILGGVGIEITRILIEGRFNHGLRNVLSSSNAASFADIHTNSFAMLAGIRFN